MTSARRARRHPEGGAWVLGCLGVQGQAGVNVLVSKDGKAKTTIAVDFARELVMVDATSEGNDAVRAGPLLGDKTRLAQFDSPDRVLLVLSRIWLRLIPRAAHSLSIDWRCSGGTSRLNSIRPSTKSRRPVSVGTRPADVCGANKSPASSRSLILLRIEAGEKSNLPDRASLLDPTGKPSSK